MSIRYPNISQDASEKTQIMQIRAFLHQLVEQLNVETGSSGQLAGGDVVIHTGSGGGSQTQDAVTTAKNTFNSIKGLIIKSADIVDAYCEVISKKLSGKYVATADFPDGLTTFIENTTHSIVADSTCTKQEFTDLQVVTGALGDWQKNTTAHIRSGLLYYEDADGTELTGTEEGTAVYGIEVGQTDKDTEGNAVFRKFARFTAAGVLFYNENGQPYVYMTNNQSRMWNVKVLGSLTRGKYVETIKADGSCVERWVEV